MTARRLSLILLMATLLTLLPAMGAQAWNDDADAYDLPEAGILLEGIGYDRRAEVIYVSGVNDGGRIYRAEVGSSRLEIWQPGNTDGRTTARGIDVDDAGRVYVAGGPTGRVFVYDSDGSLLAALSTASGVFLNDVWVGRDGAAYVTNSNEPHIYRVWEADGVWSIELWLDATASIPVVVGPGQFNLGGIVEIRNGRYLLVAQGNTGRLWRITKATGEIAEVDLGGARITDADGIVLRGRTLYVVRNFSRMITEIRLSASMRSGEVRDEIATPADRTFTTAKLVDGELLAVDSQFGLPQPWIAEDRVVALDRP